MIEKREFYIDGKWVKPEVANDFHVIDAATEEPCAVISLGSKADVDKAVAAARRAFPAWAATPREKRIALVEKLLPILNARVPVTGAAISLEMGAPIDMAISSQATCAPWHLEAFLEAAKDFKWEYDRPGRNERIIREPIGVCGLITPWNWPNNQIALKVIPALIAGCTMVLKPSEIAPLSGIDFAECMHEAGFPAGVFNLVNGDGAGVGSAMSAHADIDFISFTGSARAGILISKSAAETIKRVSLELGGKSPNIVFADSDLDKAIQRGVAHCFDNTGQSCNAPTRMLVERKVYPQAVELAVKHGSAIKVGSPREHGDHIGPLASRMQFEKVQSLIQAGIDEGARLVLGGTGRPEGFNRGWYVRPTIFADANNQMRIAREEIFGPVLVMMPFDSEEEAIEIANDTPYGLAAYVQTQDRQKAQRVSRQLRAGMVRVNGAGLSAGHPFGGYKQSGNGREGGAWGLDEFLETKIVGAW
ncbi:MAG: aldehyde dehydrogenase family protein [Nitratireductor sp.]|nr:aldehyde dehydrogenase family protein [Nitratireductor sp.]